MTRAIVLVDGEHYPPVIIDALAQLESRGYQVAAAVLLGGGEKLSGPLDLGDVAVIEGDSPLAALRTALETVQPEVVLDLSDDPIVDTRTRLLLASTALASGAPYHAADIRFEVPQRPRLCTAPSIAVIGTGKRTGKTAIASTLARAVVARGGRPVIVAMGRGGPAEPALIHGDRHELVPDELVELSRRGEHAASDSYEDAVVARVMTVGARRAGAGFAGAPMFHNVHRAVEIANGASPDVIVLEGSGTAIPPVACDATIVAVGGGTPASEIAWGNGPFRLLLGDLIVVTMAEEPILSSDTSSALSQVLSQLARDVPIVRTVFRPTPLSPVKGRKVFFATTAPDAVGEALRRHLEEAHGAHVVGITHRLADRAALSDEMARAAGRYEVLLTELKAAAVDVAIRTARAADAEVVIADNTSVPVDGDLQAELSRIEELARTRFNSHR
jgi:cyclic 2,3-diphosphoglycerate synthase